MIAKQAQMKMPKFERSYPELSPEMIVEFFPSVRRGMRARNV